MNKNPYVSLAGAVLLAIIVALILSGCEAPDTVYIPNSSSTSNAQPIEDYHIDKNAWQEGDFITTEQGHRWLVTNYDGYTGRIEVAYDGKGTADVGDDILVIALPPEN